METLARAAGNPLVVLQQVHAQFSRLSSSRRQYNVGNLPTDFKAFGKDFSSLKNYRYQGWMAGAGIGYGYDWALSRHFNLEFELGMGVIYTGYEKYDCPQCGKKVDENQKFMIAPTKAALSLVYLF